MRLLSIIRHFFCDATYFNPFTIGAQTCQTAIIMVNLGQGPRLKALIQDNGFTIEQVADRIGKRRETLSRWLSKKEIDTEIITKIADAMNWDITNVMALLAQPQDDRGQANIPVPYLMERIKFLENQLEKQIQINERNADTISRLANRPKE